jgi:hypothetical protein
MKTHFTLCLAAIGLAAFCPSSPAADHGHLNVGAVGTAQGDPLTFDNGDLFTTESAFVNTLIYTNGGTYAGYFQGNITLTALAATAAHGGPVPNAPALGSFIFAQIVSVEGPTGGAFSFWDTGATTPTIQVQTGTSSTNLFRLSENDGSPNTDPYGHIHGRRFTATQPGLYAVTFRALDLSTNGPGGGPIQTPSPNLTIYFQAGITITSLETTNGLATLTFGARLNHNYTLQATTNLLSPIIWTDASGPVAGNDALTPVTDTNASSRIRFYRIKDINP